ncbi:MAG: hypothetical protein ACRDGA_04385, partial [Bacteroidota bacterium]
LTMTPKYRILITKTLDVPKNVFTQVYKSEGEAVNAAKAKLADVDGDVAIVTELLGGNAKVIHTFEKAKKAS